MRSWLLALILVLAASLGNHLVPAMADTALGEWQRFDAVVDYASMRSEAGYPWGLYVEGYFPVDCDQPLNIEWDQRGTTLYLTLYVVAPERSCEAGRVYFAETLTAFNLVLADVSPGEYRLDVNGYRTWVRVPVAPPPTPYPPPTPVPTRRPWPTPVPTPDDEVFRAYAVIEHVEVIVLESYPMQVHLRVMGYHGTGCSSPTYIEQERVRNTVFVDIYRLVNPRMMCPAVLEYFDETIPLEGGFESGRTTFHVNDFIITVIL